MQVNMKSFNQLTERTIMHPHNQTYSPEPKQSPVQGIIITIACLAVFALWGVLLALGV